MPAVASLAIGAGGSLLSGLTGKKSSKNAAKQVAGTAQNVGNSIFNTGNANFGQMQDTLSPYLNAGQGGANALLQNFQPGGQLAQQFSFDPSQIANNPNYQFVLQQGTDAVQKSAAAQGGLFGGGTMKALDQYSQGLATNTINDAYSQALNTFQTNHQNLFQGLTALTGVGQTAVGQLQNAQNARIGAVEAGGQAYLTGAQANAAGILGQGNAWTNALNGLETAGLNYVNGTNTAVPSGSVSQTLNPLPATSPAAPAYVPNYTPAPPVVNPVPTTPWTSGDSY